MAAVQAANHAYRSRLIRQHMWDYESQMFLNHINTFFLHSSGDMTRPSLSGDITPNWTQQQNSWAQRQSWFFLCWIIMTPWTHFFYSAVLSGQAPTSHHVTGMWAHYWHSAESLLRLKPVSAGTASQQWQVETITVLWLLTGASSESWPKETALSQDSMSAIRCYQCDGH